MALSLCRHIQSQLLNIQLAKSAVHICSRKVGVKSASITPEVISLHPCWKLCAVFFLKAMGLLCMYRHTNNRYTTNPLHCFHLNSLDSFSINDFRAVSVSSTIHVLNITASLKNVFAFSTLV